MEAKYVSLDSLKSELEYGDTGIEVEYVHYYLTALAFFDKDIPKLPTNSIYNDNTRINGKTVEEYLASTFTKYKK